MRAGSAPSHRAPNLGPRRPEGWGWAACSASGWERRSRAGRVGLRRTHQRRRPRRRPPPPRAVVLDRGRVLRTGHRTRSLMGSMDLVQDGIDDPIREDLHPDRPGRRRGVRRDRAASSCQLLLVEDRRSGVGFERRPDRRGRVGQSGLRRPEGDAEVIRDLGHGQPEGIAEDEDRALLRRQSSEAAVQLVAVVDGQEPVVIGGRRVRLEQDDVRREVPTAPRLRRSRR